MENLWCVELNLDADPMSNTSWHVDNLKKTLFQNLELAIKGPKGVNRWVIVALANSYNEAHDQCDIMQRVISKRRYELGIDKEIKKSFSGIHSWLDKMEAKEISSSLKKKLTDQTELREKLLKLIMKKKLSITSAAKQIGIAYNTLDSFLKKNRNIDLIPLSKVLDFIEL